MKNFTNKGWRRNSVVAASFATVLSFLYGCAVRVSDAPAPAGVTTTTAALATARTWYEGLPSSTAIFSRPTAGAAPTKWPLALVWADAVESKPEATGRVWLVPVYETHPRFVSGNYFGHRYLVMRSGGEFSALIFEVFSEKQIGHQGTTAIAAAIVADMLHGVRRPVDGFDGAAILYDINYRYQQGRDYQQGQDPVLGERLRIGPRNTSANLSTGPKSPQPMDSGCGGGCIEYSFDGGGSGCDCSGGGVVVIGDNPDGGGGYGGGGYGGYGGDGGGGWGGNPGDVPGGGGGGGSGDPNSIDGWESASLSDATPVDGGNYAKIIRAMYGTYSTIEVRVELKTTDHTLTHVDMNLGGVTKFRSLTQKGEGVLTSYDPATDTYHFNVGFTVEYADGTMNNGIKTLVGWVCPRTGDAGIKVDE